MSWVLPHKWYKGGQDKNGGLLLGLSYIGKKSELKVNLRKILGLMCFYARQ